MLHYDVIGFQSVEWLESFLHYCRKEHGAEVDEDSGTVRIGNRSTIARAFPIGIDHDDFMALVSTGISRRSQQRLGSSARKHPIADGADRRSYRKGDSLEEGRVGKMCVSTVQFRVWRNT